MSCTRFELADVFDYSDGSLDAPQRLAFEVHAASCEECREALSDIRRIAADFERTPLPIPEPSAHFRDSVLAAAMGPLERLREEGTAPARPSPARSGTTSGADSLRPGLSDRRLLMPWRLRPIPRFAAIAASLVVIVGLFWAFGPDRRVVASILDGENVLVNGVPYSSGTVDLRPGARITTEANRAGSFISASGESVVLGPSSELRVASRDEEDGCLVLELESGRAWILIDENRGKPSGVDVASRPGSYSSVTRGQAFVHVEPDRKIRIEVASCGGAGGSDDLGSGDCPLLEMARLDDVVVQLVPGVSSKTAERARSHYDLVKPSPIHWVANLEHALTIAWNLRRPLLVVDENGGLPDELFRDDEALRRAASRYVCVRIDRSTKETEKLREKLLGAIDPPENRRFSRLLLCPKTLFRAGFDAGATVEELVAAMEKHCDDITEHWRGEKW